MKRKAQPMLSGDGQQALDQYRQVLQQFEDLSLVTIRNYLSDLRRFIVWCEGFWHNRQKKCFFTPQAVASILLIRYRKYPQTTRGLKPFTVNRTLMSLKRYFAWTRKTQLTQSDPASPIKFVPNDASPPWHLSEEEKGTLVVAVNITRVHTGLRVQELCTLTRQQVYLGKRNGTLWTMGKRKKMREVLLNTTARSILNQYLETLPPEHTYFSPSEKIQKAPIGRALRHVVEKYATQVQVADVSPHDLRQRFGYRMTEVVLLHGLAQIIGHGALDTIILHIRRTKQKLQQDVEKIA